MSKLLTSSLTGVENIIVFKFTIYAQLLSPWYETIPQFFPHLATDPRAVASQGTGNLFHLNALQQIPIWRPKSNF